MLATYLLMAAMTSEPVVELLPADRSRIPPHLEDQFTLGKWGAFHETTLKLYWAEWRSHVRCDQLERENRESIRSHNATLRKLGLKPPPDPVEPTLPYWKRLESSGLKKE